MGARGSERPRVRVAAVLVIEERLLLVRQRRTREPYYLLPGGGVDPRETLADALRREVAEETGLQIQIDRPLFINDTIDPSGMRHAVNLTFLAHITGGELLSVPTDPSIEGLELAGFDSLEALDLRPPIASELVHAAENGFDTPTRYLGAIWTPEGGPGR